MKQFFLLLIMVLYTPLAKAQTYNEYYNLSFQDVDQCEGKWAWDYSQNSCKISQLNISPKSGVLISYNNWKTDREMRITLFKNIILPTIFKNHDIKLILTSKNAGNKPFLFSVTGLDQNGNTSAYRSIAVNNKNWSTNVLSFALTKEKAISINIDYKGDSTANQDICLEKIIIEVNGRNINDVSTTESFKKDSINAINSFNKKNIQLLNTDNDSTLLSGIKELYNKKIIGLGECTHGSATVNNATYQFAKNLIHDGHCRLVLLENPVDVTLVWNLYVQGLLPGDYKEKIINSLKTMLIDSNQFFDFLSWIRLYNSHNQEKVLLLGVDNFKAPQLNLFDYHLALLGGKKGDFYLKQIGKKNYSGIIKYAQNDSVLKSVLGSQNLQFYISMIKSIDTLEKDDNIRQRQENRDVNMSQRISEMTDLYLKPGEKAVMLAHSAHLKRLINFDAGKSNPSYPLGFYLNKIYGNQFSSISFQVSSGDYIQQECGSTQMINDKLPAPPTHSFEYGGLLTGLNYFYYPSHNISSQFSSFCLVPVGNRNINYYPFSSKGNFDGIVFIRRSEALKNVEKYVGWYTHDYYYLKNRDMKELLSRIDH